MSPATAQTLPTSPLTREAFAPFGEVLEADGPSGLINGGETQKFAHLATAQTRTPPALHVFRSLRACGPSVMLHQLERHPHGSQAFVPMTDRPFLVVVAEGVPQPDARHLRAFMTNGRQGVNIGRGIWHHHLITLDEGQLFVVVDDGGPENLELVALAPPLLLETHSWGNDEASA